MASRLGLKMETQTLTKPMLSLMPFVQAILLKERHVIRNSCISGGTYFGDVFLPKVLLKTSEGGVWPLLT